MISCHNYFGQMLQLETKQITIKQQNKIIIEIYLYLFYIKDKLLEYDSKYCKDAYFPINAQVIICKTLNKIY